MKKNYFTLCFAFSQNYNLGLVNVSGFDFKVVAIPDFTSTSTTDISDVGFTLVLPAGNVDIANAMALLSARTGTVQEFDAAFLTGLGLGDGTKDVFLFNMPPGQSMVSHTAGEQIDLFSFQITNSPTIGDIYFLLNTDPIALGAGNVLDSFYNSNIDGTTTQDYFSASQTGLDSFSFNKLSTDDFNLNTSDFEISVFPNPSSEVFNIETKHEVKSIKLFDITGKLALETTQTKSINVKKLPSGVYLMKINTLTNSITKKVIVE